MLQTTGWFAALAFLLTISSCRDTDYDLGNVDTTIGLGSSMTFPTGNSTTDICLNDVLDLGNTNFLKVAPDGNYNIDVVDDEPFAAHIWVNQFNVPSKTYTGTYDLDLGDLAPETSQSRAARASDEISFDAPMVDMDFTYDYKTNQITRLEYIGLEEGTLQINLSFSQGVKKCLNNIQEVRFQFPECVECGKAYYRGDSVALSAGNQLKLYNVSPASDLGFALHVKGIHLSEQPTSGSYMTYTKGEGFKFHASLGIGGTVKVSDVNINQIRSAGKLQVQGTAVLNRMKVVSARGGFTPSRKFGKVGGVSLKNVPSFLTDKEVDLDLYNPQLNIDIDSDVPFANKMTGAIVSKDAKGNLLKRIEVPQFSYKANGKSVISVRRRAEATTGDTTVIVIPEICDLIRNLPDSIALVDLVGVGDDSQTADIQLGRNYRGMMVLSVASGIALDENAVVVYKHTYRGWNDQMKDISFVENTKDGVKSIDGYIRATAQVENKIPAYLTLSAYGVDVNGNEISSDQLQVSVDKTIAPSKDGRTPVTTEVKIVLTPKDNAVFSKLDGVAFRVKMSAKTSKGTPVTGVLLNAYHQTIKVTSLKLQKMGKIAVDLN